MPAKRNLGASDPVELALQEGVRWTDLGVAQGEEDFVPPRQSSDVGPEVANHDIGKFGFRDVHPQAAGHTQHLFFALTNIIIIRDKIDTMAMILQRLDDGEKIALSTTCTPSRQPHNIMAFDFLAFVVELWLTVSPMLSYLLHLVK